ncbi:peptide deformylase [Candidatus Synechococcus spongiarum]|uniref:Peptide deformylase n=1 Tax=Candidatus Synechococcus spongiarum TaxID=431041 RepID=A0A171DHQ9_9SYNE|nr:peptide deformylase [Candidatus Synechococcus spongiarum]SAY39361.1 Peptide deformylase (EC 3.5.1.88) [Candidatus Synechococcus spongiarum]
MAGASFASLAHRAARREASVAVEKQVDGPAPLTIHHLGDRVLRQPARRVSRVDHGIRQLCRDMLRSMYSAQGIGLAATQVGVHKQVLVIDLDPETPSSPPLVLINPEITAWGASVDSREEGCLSIPGVYLNVVRPTVVEVKFTDELGRNQRRKADGLLGRCIQHEMDHLNGILFVDRVQDVEALERELDHHGFVPGAVHAVV